MADKDIISRVKDALKGFKRPEEEAPVRPVDIATIRAAVKRAGIQTSTPVLAGAVRPQPTTTTAVAEPDMSLGSIIESYQLQITNLTSQVMSLHKGVQILLDTPQIPGPKGDIGPQGELGLQGERGLQGIRGEIGLQGVRGERGFTGEQ